MTIQRILDTLKACLDISTRNSTRNSTRIREEKKCREQGRDKEREKIEDYDHEDRRYQKIQKKKD